MRSLSAIFIIFIFLGTPRPAQALDETMFLALQQNMQDLQKTVLDLQQTVATQNEIIHQQGIKISALEETRHSSHGTHGFNGPSAEGPLKAAGFRHLKPEVGMAGTVEAKLTELSEDGEGNDTIALKEIERNRASGDSTH
jgi:hypothetical protein